MRLWNSVYLSRKNCIRRNWVVWCISRVIHEKQIPKDFRRGGISNGTYFFAIITMLIIAYSQCVKTTQKVSFSYFLSNSNIWKKYVIFLSRNSNIQLTKKMRHFLEFFITVSKSKLSNYPLVFSKGEENDYCHYILLRMITGRVSDDSCLLETLYEKSCNDAIHLYLYSTGGITVIDPFSRGFSLLFSCQKILMKCMQLPLFASFAFTKHPSW